MLRIYSLWAQCSNQSRPFIHMTHRLIYHLYEMSWILLDLTQKHKSDWLLFTFLLHVCPGYCSWRSAIQTGQLGKTYRFISTVSCRYGPHSNAKWCHGKTVQCICAVMQSESFQQGFSLVQRKLTHESLFYIKSYLNSTIMAKSLKMIIQGFWS